MMDEYSSASDKVGEARGTLSIKDTALDDTAIRKLVSATRTGVQANFGHRQKLIDMLAEKEPTLPAAIAGQAAASWVPRGLVARFGSPAAIGSSVTAAFSNPWAALGIPAAIAVTSPRIVGETVHFGGRAVGGIERGAEYLGATAPRARAAGDVSFQAGRLSDQEKKRLLAQLLMRGNEQRAR